MLYKSPFVFKSDLKLGQISVCLPTPPMSQFHMQQILGFGSDPLAPFGTMSLIHFLRHPLLNFSRLFLFLVSVSVSILSFDPYFSLGLKV